MKCKVHCSLPLTPNLSRNKILITEKGPVFLSPNLLKNERKHTPKSALSNTHTHTYTQNNINFKVVQICLNTGGFSTINHAFSVTVFDADIWSSNIPGKHHFLMTVVLSHTAKLLRITAMIEFFFFPLNHAKANTTQGAPLTRKSPQMCLR